MSGIKISWPFFRLHLLVAVPLDGNWVLEAPYKLHTAARNKASQGDITIYSPVWDLLHYQSFSAIVSSSPS